MDKKEMPDLPTPKDLAMLDLLNRLKRLDKLQRDEVTTLAQEIGWVQYNCTNAKYKNYDDQFGKLIDRFVRKIEDTLLKRGIE
jgi:hypothetical protein